MPPHDPRDDKTPMMHTQSLPSISGHRGPLFSLLILACAAACGDSKSGGSDTGGGSSGTTAAATTTTTNEPTTAAATTTTGEATTSMVESSATGSETGDPAGAQCQAELQDCPDNFKCVLRRGEIDWEFVCLPVQGEHEAGDSCHHDGVIAGTDDCDQSSWCIGAFDTTGNPWDGLCYPLCVGMSCELEQRCVGIGALPVCAPICDPLSGSGCGSEEACIYRPPEGFVCFPESDDGKKIGEVCETGISCEAGLHCSQKVAGCGPDEYCCTDYCDLGNPMNTCAQQAEGASCVAIGATDPSQSHVGGCVVEG